MATEQESRAVQYTTQLTTLSSSTTLHLLPLLYSLTSLSITNASTHCTPQHTAPRPAFTPSLTHYLESAAQRQLCCKFQRIVASRRSLLCTPRLFRQACYPPTLSLATLSSIASFFHTGDLRSGSYFKAVLPRLYIFSYEGRSSFTAEPFFLMSPRSRLPVSFI